MSYHWFLGLKKMLYYKPKFPDDSSILDFPWESDSLIGYRNLMTFPLIFRPLRQTIRQRMGSSTPACPSSACPEQNDEGTNKLLKGQLFSSSFVPFEDTYRDVSGLGKWAHFPSLVHIARARV